MRQIDDPGTLAKAEHSGVDDFSASAIAVQGVGKSQASVIMTVYRDLGVGIAMCQLGLQLGHEIIHAARGARDHVACRIRDADNIGTGVHGSHRGIQNVLEV